MLLSITVDSTSRNRSVGKFCGRQWAFAEMNSHRPVTPVQVSILVYIDLALAENSWAPSESCMFRRSSITDIEFLI
jgi:hypothetical protein